MEIRPLGNKLFIKAVEDFGKPASSLIIKLDKPVEKPPVGELTHIGPDVDDKRLVVGAKVLLAIHELTPLPGIDLYGIRQEKVMALLTPINDQLAITPLGKRVAIKRLPDETEVAGFIIPETLMKKINKGTVYSVSKEVPEGIFPIGAEVLFNKYAGVRVSWGGEEFIVMGDDDIELIFEKDEPNE